MVTGMPISWLCWLLRWSAVKTTIDLTDTLMSQADGLPMFRRDPAVAPQIPSLQELWELEHTTLAAEDQQRACFPG